MPADEARAGPKPEVHHGQLVELRRLRAYPVGTLVLTINATSEVPEKSYVRDDFDGSLAPVVEEAATVCVEEGRPGYLWVTTGDDTSRGVAKITASGDWRWA